MTGAGELTMISRTGNLLRFGVKYACAPGHGARRIADVPETASGAILPGERECAGDYHAFARRHLPGVSRAGTPRNYLPPRYWHVSMFRIIAIVARTTTCERALLFMSNLWRF